MYVLARYQLLMVDIAMFRTSSGVRNARSTSGLFGFVISRSVEQAAISTTAAPPTTARVHLCIIVMAVRSLLRRSRSELDLDLTGDRAEVGIPEAVDAEVEVVPGGDFRIEATVVGPRVQV